MPSKKKPKVVITPHYLLSRKQKRQYEGTSEVIYFMDEIIYDINNIKPIDELHEADYEKARDYIIKMKERFGSEKLKKAWNLSTYNLYNKLYEDYSIPKDGSRGTVKVEKFEVYTSNDKSNVNNKEPKFVITLNGEFEDLQERLTNIAALLKSDGKYNICLKIEEE